MKKILALLIALMLVCTGCGVSEETKLAMRKKSANQENFHVVAQHIWSDLTDLTENAVETITDGYNTYAPMAKEKAEDIISNAKENGPDIVRDYVDHQTEFWGDAIDSITGKAPVMPEGVELEGPFTILWVSDGDTFAVKNNGKETYVRITGVDTPESVASDDYLTKSGKSNSDEGREASAFTKDLLKKTGMKVWLEKDVQEEDTYGRWLRYAYINVDGQLRMLNEILLEEGMARMMTIAPNIKYADTVFKDAQQRAIEEHKGFWDTGFYKEEE